MEIVCYAIKSKKYHRDDKYVGNMSDGVSILDAYKFENKSEATTYLNDYYTSKDYFVTRIVLKEIGRHCENGDHFGEIYSSVPKCYKCGAAICDNCMNAIATPFGDYVCEDCYANEEELEKFIEKCHEDFGKAMEGEQK